MTMLSCKDLPGSDYRSIGVTTPVECSDVCLNDNQCLAATFVHAVNQNPSCWLKNAVPAAQNAQCDMQLTVHSFVKEQIATVLCVMSNPQADFTVSQHWGFAPHDVRFTDLSTGTTSKSVYTWDFGDGTPVSHERNPYHGYNTGTPDGIKHTVSLTVTGACPDETNTTTIQNYIKVVDNLGILDIATTPSGANVRIDSPTYGTVSGYTTPFTTDEGIPVGTYTVRLTLPGYKDYTTMVTIENRKHTPLSYTFEKISSPDTTTGSLNVVTTPSGASVYLDDGLKGTTPLTIPDLAATKYLLKITKTGYTDFQQSATVTAGKQTQVTLTLVKKDETTKPITSMTTQPSGSTGEVSITTSPSGASVNLDGWDKGKTPVTLQKVNIGSHTLKISLAGYQDKILTVPVETGKTTTVTAFLNLSVSPTVTGSGTLTIRSSPAGANVYLDGGKVGTTTVILQGVTAGTHNLLLTMKDYSDVSQKIDVTAGSDKEITIDLGKKAPGFGLPVTLCALAVIGIFVVVRRKGR